MSRINVKVIRHYASMYVKRFTAATKKFASLGELELTFILEGEEVPITFFTAEGEEVPVTFDGGYYEWQ